MKGVEEGVQFNFYKGDEKVVTNEALKARRLAIYAIATLGMMDMRNPSVAAVGLVPHVEALFSNLPAAVDRLNISLFGYDGPFEFVRTGDRVLEKYRITLEHAPANAANDQLVIFSESIPHLAQVAGIA